MMWSPIRALELNEQGLKVEHLEAVIRFSGDVHESCHLFLTLFMCVQIVEFCKLVDYVDSAFGVLTTHLTCKVFEALSER